MATNEVLPRQAEMLMYATQRVEELTGAVLGDVPTNVYWTSTVCEQDPQRRTAVVYDGACYHGLTFACDEMYVAIREPITATALLHEFGHCLLLYQGLNGDRDHVNTKWWNMMDQINAELK